MEKINWGIIGLGNVAHKFSEAFKDIKNSKLLAAASKDKNKLNIFKEKYNFEDKFLFNTYEELIDCANGKLFGPGNAKLPSPPMLMFNRITNIQDNKGKFKKGLIYSLVGPSGSGK